MDIIFLLLRFRVAHLIMEFSCFFFFRFVRTVPVHNPGFGQNALTFENLKCCLGTDGISYAIFRDAFIGSIVSACFNWIYSKQGSAIWEIFDLVPRLGTCQKLTVTFHRPVSGTINCKGIKVLLKFHLGNYVRFSFSFYGKW